MVGEVNKVSSPVVKMEEKEDKSKRKNGIKEDKNKRKNGIKEDKNKRKNGIKKDKNKRKNGIKKDKNKKKNGIKEDKNKKKNGIKEDKSDESTAHDDVVFCLFYYRAVKRLLDIDKKENVFYLYRYAKIFHAYYDFSCQVRLDLVDQNDSIMKMLKTCLYYRIMHVYKNATLVSSAIAFHLWNVYKRNTHILERVIKKKIVKICSIGGSSAPDIVAVITVLKSIASKNDIQLDFRVTIIDINNDWKNTCFTVLRCLEEFRKGIWKINFIPSDLANTNTWTPETMKAIQEADVITMVKYISNYGYKKCIVEMIGEELKSEAIFFVLDHPVKRQIELYLSIGELGGLHLIGVELYDFHTLELEAVKQFRTLYRKHFGNEKLLRSNIFCNLFVCVWLKASSETDTKLKKNLECVFQTNDEKFNPKQTFLGSHALTRWEKLFTKKKRAAGWSEKRIKEYVQKEKAERSNIFGKFIREKKGVDSLQNQLLNQVRRSNNFKINCSHLLGNDGKKLSDRNEKSLDHYLVQKRQYSLIKKNAYFASLSGNNLYSVTE